jgi:hypothetical protein
VAVTVVVAVAARTGNAENTVDRADSTADAGTDSAADR